MIDRRSSLPPTTVKSLMDRPAENAEDEVEHEEWADDDEADEVDPRPAVSVDVVDLTRTSSSSFSLIDKFSIMELEHKNWKKLYTMKQS